MYKRQGFISSSEVNDRTIYAFDAKSNPKFGLLTRGSFAIIKDNYKLIQYRESEIDLTNELYDLENDPEELENLYTDNQKISKELEIELNEQLGSVNQKYRNQ